MYLYLLSLSLSHVCWLVGWLVGVSSDGSLRRLWISTSISFLLRYVMLIFRIFIERFDWCFGICLRYGLCTRRQHGLVLYSGPFCSSYLEGTLVYISIRFMGDGHNNHGNNFFSFVVCNDLEYDLAAWRRVCICLCNFSSWHLKRLLKILCTSCYSVIPSSMSPCVCVSLFHLILCFSLVLWIQSFILV